MSTYYRTETDLYMAPFLNGFIHQWLTAVSIITESIS